MEEVLKWCKINELNDHESYYKNSDHLMKNMKIYDLMINQFTNRGRINSRNWTIRINIHTRQFTLIIK